jgi:hypothetical protein
MENARGNIMCDLIRHNWLSIFSLLVATIGGVPGIVSVIRQFNSKARLIVNLIGGMTGTITFPNDSNEYTIMLFSMTISNEGSNPLSPSVFNMAIKSGNKYIKLQNRLIPEDMKIQSNVQEIRLKEPWKHDLLRYQGVISEAMPVNGHLLYATNEITLKSLQSMTIIKCRMECIDVLNRHHIVTFDFKKKPVTGEVIYPKHDITISKIENKQ